MWSQVPAVQVIIWRLLNRLDPEPWAQDLLDMLYLEDDILTWAKTNTNEDSLAAVKHKDSNGASLQNGDTVTLTKDLNVKGVSFTAKRGTAVRNISLVTDNSEQLEGRVNGTQIVILTKFVKRAN
jgi:protein PhnA